jgi:hypothetical protein
MWSSHIPVNSVEVPPQESLPGVTSEVVGIKPPPPGAAQQQSKQERAIVIL